eukprot:gb/GECG01005117.1/.p1 GENE.gb/GECG01005117.1/~~gb/GECG01005117.1/.p1  ORF type:complete len:758 (+),score=126.82 gb/GECG01005117.1/:1-2274(+)
MSEAMNTESMDTSAPSSNSDAPVKESSSTNTSENATHASTNNVDAAKTEETSKSIEVTGTTDGPHAAGMSSTDTNGNNATSTGPTGVHTSAGSLSGSETTGQTSSSSHTATDTGITSSQNHQRSETTTTSGEGEDVTMSGYAGAGTTAASEPGAAQSYSTASSTVQPSQGFSSATYTQHSQPPTSLSEHRRRNEPRANSDNGAKAIMEGDFLLDRSNKSVQFKGKWHMYGDTTTAEFEYKSSGVESFPQDFISKEVSASVSLAGYFYFLSGPTPEKIEESDIQLRIGGPVPADQDPQAKLGLQQSDSIVALGGTGKNKFGQFSLVGEYDTRSSKAVLLKKYELGPSSPAPRRVEKPKTPKPQSNAPPPVRVTRKHRPKKPPTKFTSDDTESPLFSMSPEMRDCYQVLSELMSRVEAQWFLRPVDDAQFPDYYDIIRRPMDFQTIQSNLLSQSYNDVRDFSYDVHQVFKNCFQYNPPNSPAYEHATILKNAFEDKLAKMHEEQRRRDSESKRRAAEQNKVAAKSMANNKTPTTTKNTSTGTFSSSKSAPGKGAGKTYQSLSGSSFSDLNKKQVKRKRDDDSSVGSFGKKKAKDGSGSFARSESGRKGAMDQSNPSIADLTKRVRELEDIVMRQSRDIEELQGMISMPTKAEEAPLVGPGSVYDTDVPLDLSEKQQLSEDVNNLNAEQIQRLLEIVKEYYPMNNPENENEYEIDLNSVNTPGLRRLQQYVDSCLGRSKSSAATRKNQPKAKQKNAEAAC